MSTIAPFWNRTRRVHPEFADATFGDLPGCTGPCDQGRRECPTPDACRVPESEPLGYRVVVWVCTIGGVLFVGALLGGLL